MHSLMFVCIPKEKVETSEKAREHVVGYLAAKEGFLGADSNPPAGLADYFAIGGRWSGVLTTAHLDSAKLEQFEEEFNKTYRLSNWCLSVYGKEEVTKQQLREQAKALWKKYFPDYEGEMVYWRDTIEDDDTRMLGYEDDAMIVDTRIYERFVKGKVQDRPGSGVVIFEDQQKDDPEKIIGNYWIVVVDYHW